MCCTGTNQTPALVRARLQFLVNPAHLGPLIFQFTSNLSHGSRLHLLAFSDPAQKYQVSGAVWVKTRPRSETSQLHNLQHCNLGSTATCGRPCRMCQGGGAKKAKGQSSASGITRGHRLDQVIVSGRELSFNEDVYLNSRLNVCAVHILRMSVRYAGRNV